MKSSAAVRFGAVAAASALSALVGLSAGAAQGQGSTTPFAAFAGSWQGDGTVTLTSGSSERIRCRATYTVGKGGLSLQQDLRCASDSYNFVISSGINYDNGYISGSWTEKTRNSTGELHGRVADGLMTGLVAGVGFSADVSVSTKGAAQQVAIKPSDATGISALEISMKKQ